MIRDYIAKAANGFVFLGIWRAIEKKQRSRLGWRQPARNDEACKLVGRNPNSVVVDDHGAESKGGGK